MFCGVVLFVILLLCCVGVWGLWVCGCGWVWMHAGRERRFVRRPQLAKRQINTGQKLGRREVDDVPVHQSEAV